MLVIEEFFNSFIVPQIVSGDSYQISEEEYNRIKEEELKKQQLATPTIYNTKPLHLKTPEEDILPLKISNI